MKTITVTYDHFIKAGGREGMSKDEVDEIFSNHLNCPLYQALLETLPKQTKQKWLINFFRNIFRLNYVSAGLDHFTIGLVEYDMEKMFDLTAFRNLVYTKEPFVTKYDLSYLHNHI